MECGYRKSTWNATVFVTVRMLAHIMMVYLTYLHLLNNLEQIFIDYEQNKSGKNQKCNLIVML